MTAHSATLRWLAVALLAASLLGLAAVPEAGGLAVAAVLWIVAFAMLERARIRDTR